MVHPRSKADRRRNAIAKDLRTDKYRQRIVKPKSPEDNSWKEDLQEYHDPTRPDFTDDPFAVPEYD